MRICLPAAGKLRPKRGPEEVRIPLHSTVIRMPVHGASAWIVICGIHRHVPDRTERNTPFGAFRLHEQVQVCGPDAGYIRLTTGPGPPAKDPWCRSVPKQFVQQVSILGYEEIVADAPIVFTNLESNQVGMI